jgi:maltooligosyltrehalose trehalohydrolase
VSARVRAIDPARPVRRMPIGAEPVPGGGVHFRVWAPRPKRVAVVIEERALQPRRRPRIVALEPEGDDYFSATIPHAAAGSRYRFLLDDEGPFPDPASRFQPDGPHGASQVIDPAAFAWTDGEWQGVPPDSRVLYEMHIGTFTAAGTWAAAARRLPALATLGVTVLEIMPVADFPGHFGWGYDGVNLFAPTRLYGEPDDFRGFVDQAHALGLGVILDVVYNHLGPDGNYLDAFSDHYFTQRHQTEWGRPFDFDGPGSRPVREYILANTAYWIREYHLDGFRLDATQAIFDAADGEAHIVAQIARTARRAAGDRLVYVTGENEPQSTVHVRAVEHGGHALDALYSDDWHHSAVVALTGRKEAYYSDYLGAPQEFISAAKYGFLYQGQFYEWQQQRRGTPALDLPPASFVFFLQNHDQIANSARGDRIHRLTSPGQLRALTALLLLGPATPMLFQGQEFAASAPFLYFADHEPPLAYAVQRGRRKFLEQFPSLATPELQEAIDDAADPATFERCKLNHAERRQFAETFALHRDLLELRHEDATFRGRGPGGIDGAVLGSNGFALRFFGETARRGSSDDRLLLVNLGRALRFSPAPEPLLAAPRDRRWSVRWSSEDVRYGGSGYAAPETADGRWQIAGQCAIVLAPE